jgi:hypothetical protein
MAREVHRVAQPPAISLQCGVLLDAVPEAGWYTSSTTRVERDTACEEDNKFEDDFDECRMRACFKEESETCLATKVEAPSQGCAG